MKHVLILCYALISTATYAGVACDINFSAAQITGAQETKVIFQDSYRGAASKGEQAAADILDAKLLATCKASGAINCTIKNREGNLSNTANYIGLYFGEWWLVSATAEGVKLIGGEKLTEKELAKKRQIFVCQKLNSCIRDALNDNNSSLNYLEKLNYVKDSNRCNEIENFIF